MKKLFVALIVLTPFVGVSQTLGSGFIISTSKLQSPITNIVADSTVLRTGWIVEPNKPDTFSAYLLVTTRRMGAAYQKRGFIVRQYGKEYIYLDCDKKVIKPPFNVWQFRIINQPK